MNNELICTPVAIKKAKYTVVCHDLWQDDNGKYFLYSTDEGDRMPDSAIELYLVSEEEIKEGDWIYDVRDKYLGKHSGKSMHPDYEKAHYRKVIATTDKSLSLPLIPSSFIERWVNERGKIDKVRVKLRDGELIIFTKGDGEQYVIILPIEDSLQTLKDYISYCDEKIEMKEWPLSLDQWKEFNEMTWDPAYLKPIEDKTYSREEVKAILNANRIRTDRYKVSTDEWFDLNY